MRQTRVGYIELTTSYTIFTFLFSFSKSVCFTLTVLLLVYMHIIFYLYILLFLWNISYINIKFIKVHYTILLAPNIKHEQGVM